MTLRNAFEGLAVESKQDAAIADAKSNEFWRIKSKRFADNEEVRYLVPAILTSDAVYIGVAPAGTPEATAIWTVIRIDFDVNAKLSRERIRFNLAWTNVTGGW